MADPTRFEQLCSAYKTTRSNFFNYRDGCIALLRAVAEQLRTEWCIPDLKFVPLDQEIEGGKTYFPHGATHYDFDEGLFHMGVAFRVYSAANTHPQDGIVVRLSARKEGDDFLLSVARRATHNVGRGDPDRVRPVLDELFAILDAEYVRNPQELRYVRDAPERRVLGFVHEKGEDKS